MTGPRDQNGGDNPIRRLVAELEAKTPARKPSKANRTFSLTEPQAAIFFNYCRHKGFKAGEVVDALIGQFLKEVWHDLPPDPALPPDERKPYPGEG
jgi:hypothetical protein